VYIGCVEALLLCATSLATKSCFAMVTFLELHLHDQGGYTVQWLLATFCFSCGEW
jgi:hypothetical protein